MIVAYELHIETRRTIGSMLTYLKTKNITADYWLCEEGHGMLTVRHPSGSSHNFKVKLYSKKDDVFVYEICSYTESEFDYLKEIAKDL